VNLIPVSGMLVTLHVSHACVAQDRIARLEAERLKLVESLQGTHLDLKMFVPLLIKYEAKESGAARIAARRRQAKPQSCS
jgi:hypothetical protein